MAKSKLIKANKVVEKAVVSTYKKIEDTVVGQFNKVSDTFVDHYLTHDGESVKQAKKRLADQQAKRKTQTPN